MAVLFDLDGTLLDTAPDFYYALNLLLQEEDKVHAYPGHDAVRPMISHGSRHIIRELFDVHEEHEDHERLIKRFLELYQSSQFAGTELFPGIENLLNSLESKGIQWGIVTNKPEFLTFPLLEVIGLDQRAGCIVCGDTTPHSKPHPEPLFHACRILDVSPEDCIYVGDAERDVAAGKSAGMKTIAAMFGYIPDKATAKSWPADHHVNEVEDIQPICFQRFNL